MTVPLPFLLEALDLKDEPRAGWVLRGVESPESVAAHSWGVAFLALLFCDRSEAPLDRERVLALAVVHDVAEARTGDVATRAEAGAQRVTDEAKTERERDAMTAFDERANADLLGLWTEYEARETPEARFVKDMDLVDNCLQALWYERERRYDPAAESEQFEEYDRLDEFFATAEPRLRTDVGRELFDCVEAAYRTAKAE